MKKRYGDMKKRLWLLALTLFLCLTASACRGEETLVEESTKSPPPQSPSPEPTEAPLKEIIFNYVPEAALPESMREEYDGESVCVYADDQEGVAALRFIMGSHYGSGYADSPRAEAHYGVVDGYGQEIIPFQYTYIEREARWFDAIQYDRWDEMEGSAYAYYGADGENLKEALKIERYDTLTPLTDELYSWKSGEVYALRAVSDDRILLSFDSEDAPYLVFYNSGENFAYDDGDHEQSNLIVYNVANLLAGDDTPLVVHENLWIDEKRGDIREYKSSKALPVASEYPHSWEENKGAIDPAGKLILPTKYRKIFPEKYGLIGVDEKYGGMEKYPNTAFDMEGKLVAGGGRTVEIMPYGFVATTLYFDNDPSAYYSIQREIYNSQGIHCYTIPGQSYLYTLDHVGAFMYKNYEKSESEISRAWLEYESEYYGYWRSLGHHELIRVDGYVIIADESSFPSLADRDFLLNIPGGDAPADVLTLTFNLHLEAPVLNGLYNYVEQRWIIEPREEYSGFYYETLDGGETVIQAKTENGYDIYRQDGSLVMDDVINILDSDSGCMLIRRGLRTGAIDLNGEWLFEKSLAELYGWQ